MTGHKKGFYEKFIKRPQDFLCALAAIVVLSPVMLVTAILVRTKLGSPIIFKQERPGLNGKIFTLYKFRTMTDKKDENGNLKAEYTIEGMHIKPEGYRAIFADVMRYVRE